MQNSTRVTFAWTEISGYMAACWNEFQNREGITLSVVLIESDRPYDDTVSLELQNIRVLKKQDKSGFRTAILKSDPQVLVICGWGIDQMRELACGHELNNTKKVVVLDTHWHGTLRQQLGLFYLRRLMRRFSAAVVACDRGRPYARRLGFSESQICNGMYGVDVESFSRAIDLRESNWPKQFTFIGRYAPEKGIENLICAYRIYCDSVSNPWPLKCFGNGPLKSQILECPGIIDGGFVQPKVLPNLLAESGVFVLPSDYEPWGAVIAEAAAAGLPIICTSACGASIDIVHNCFNGYTVAPGDSSQLSRAFRWAHDNYERLPLFGKRSSELVGPYSAQSWADRWEELIRRLTQVGFEDSH